MDYKKEKEFTFFSLILIITLDISLLCQTITCLIFYWLLTPITIISLCLFIYYINEDRKNKLKNLENILYIDKKTGLPNKNSFLNDVNKSIKNNKDYCVLIFGIINKENQDNANKFIVKYIKENILNKKICASIDENSFALMSSYRFKTDIMDIIKEIEYGIKKNSPKNKLFCGVYYIKNKRFSSTLILNKTLLAYNKSINEKELYNIYEEGEKIIGEDIEESMVSSLENKKFVIYYQPKYKINRKKIIGYEALVRWNHPKLGFLFPDKFLPIMENNDFIKEIDIYVINEVCRLIKTHPKKMLPISINISKNSIDKNFGDKVNEIVESYQIPKNLIEFEFTENIIYENNKLFIEMLNNLNKMGFKTTIDDFCIEVSSLDVIEKIPAACFKIDQEFLISKDKKDKQLIIDLIKKAKVLNKKIIVEKVEKSHEVKLLKTLNCEYIQGYYYSKPLTKQELIRILK